MVKYYRLILSHKDSNPAYTTELITIGDKSIIAKALMDFFYSGETDNKEAHKMAEEFLKNSEIEPDEINICYDLVDEFIEDVLNYFGYIYHVDIEDETTIYF